MAEPSNALTTFNGPWAKQWARVRVEGPDAEDFLHRLTTAHARAMPVGESRRAFILNPQGRVRSAFFLYRRATDSFWLVLDGGSQGQWTTELLATLDQFHFGEKLTFAKDGEAPNWVFGGSGGDSSVTGIGHGDRDFGRDWISVWADFGKVPSGAGTISERDLEDLRIRHLTPRMDLEISAQTNPLDVGLIDGIAENKGCYPGQEVIEKVIALGSPAKRLVRVEGAGLRVGITLKDAADGTELGALTSVSSDGCEGLALVRKTAAQVGHALVVGDTSQARVAQVSVFK